MFAATEGYVREVIHAFNDSGFAALSPKWRGSRPAKFGPAARDQICRIAACKPTELGLPFTTWSLAMLVDYLAEHAWIRASTETVRKILREEGVAWQSTKTWKASKDPDSIPKKTRILDLYDHPPVDGRVIYVDEFGPLNLQPRLGSGWSPRGRPARLRATYTRTGGVRHMFAALDLASGQIFYRSVTASAGHGFSTSASSCAAASRLGSFTWSVTTTDPTAKARSSRGARPTTSS
ncbi:helix-turn-helix domain-containing protein [Amycolatopsis lurida]|uniref:helix-turn-helix domain-containing protein n=1 Tax=Amycolatopsis lurida TaxID=31959 RepID=UPI000AC9D27D|nr:helix-turn-helix domain-containing protein [Amycolatopsis lurida]